MSTDKNLKFKSNRSTDGIWTGASFSGKEPNHLFLRIPGGSGEQFDDVSLVSGVDHIGDSRSFGILDYDRDGWPDLAVINANRPMLQLFRNSIGEFPGAAGRNMLAVRLVGGNREADSTTTWSNRDGYGARIELQIGEVTLHREHRGGEGMAAQNSTTLLIGMGQAARADSLRVRWPSGKQSTLSGIDAGQLLTIYEDPAMGPGGQAFDRRPYRKALFQERPVIETDDTRRFALPGVTEASPPLRMYTTMATWCESCKRELPQLGRIREAFADTRLEMYGVPTDLHDDAERLQAYVDSQQPSYRLLAELTTQKRNQVNTMVKSLLGMDVLPATIITTGDGTVVYSTPGVPSLSELRILERDLARKAAIRSPSSDQRKSGTTAPAPSD